MSQKSNMDLGKRKVVPPAKTTYNAPGETTEVQEAPVPRVDTGRRSPVRAQSVCSKSSSVRQKDLQDVNLKKRLLALKAEHLRRKLVLEQKIRQLEAEAGAESTEAAEARGKEINRLKQELSDMGLAYDLEVSLLEEDNKIKKEEIDLLADDGIGQERNELEGLEEPENVDQRVQKFVENIPETSRNRSPSPDQIAMDCLAKAITRGLGKGKPKDLPEFSGRARDWPIFLNEFNRTTEEHDVSHSANLIRIRKALDGAAKTAVLGLLDEPSCVPEIIKILGNRFGRPEFILEELIESAREVKSPDVNKPDTLIAYGTVVQNLVARIKSMNKRQYLYDVTLLRELVRKLPTLHATEWLKWVSSDDTREENLDYFAQWIMVMVSYAERLYKPRISEKVKEEPAEEKKGARARRGLGVHAAVKDDNTEGCLYCDKSNHEIGRCFKFKKIKYEDKKEFIGKNGLCFRCLKKGHRAVSCEAPVSCDVKGCKDKSSHHPIIHVSSSKSRNRSKSPVEGKSDNETEVEMSANSVSARHNILPIIPVVLKGPTGIKVKVHALLDTAASFCMMEQKLADELKLEGPVEKLKFSVFQDQRVDDTSRNVSLEIAGDFPRAPFFQVPSVHTIAKMGLPGRTFDAEAMKKKHPHLRKMKLKSMKNAKPQLLLGVNRGGLFAAREILEPALGEAPAAVKSLLGWYVIEDGATVNKHFQFMSLDEQMHADIKDFVAVENLGVKELPSHRSKEDLEALKIFNESAVLKDNRWTIALPWRNKDEKLPSSYEMALRRLGSMEKKMWKDPDFKKLINEKFEDYVKCGYLRKVDPGENVSSRKWYLPWFLAYHPSKKPRLVFDGAAKAHGKSLNDFLYTGPDLLCSLNSVLLRFRRHSIALTADIKTMFHQVGLAEEDWPSQTILYRPSQDESVQELVMTVLFFGAASSPSQACFVKDKNAMMFEAEHPEAVKATLKDFYVDDLLTGAEDADEAVKLQQDVTRIHQQGGFPLVKWNSSCEKVLDQIPPDLRANVSEMKLQGKSDVEWDKTLGMLWSPQSDEFSFRLSPEKIPEELWNGSVIPTKRKVTSVVMSVFDPLGFLAVLKMKGLLLIQRIWKTGIGWDDHVDSATLELWMSWLEEIKSVVNIRIPRRLCPTSLEEVSETQLHVFCDASEKAYACCAYLRFTTGGSVHTTLVMGKVRIGPLKGLTVPRMELNAALIGARLASFIRKSFGPDLNIDGTTFWTDSSTVLHWIRATDKTFKVYVANRICEIQELTDVKDWRWVPSSENVADDATKEKNLELTSKSRWYHGPVFLKQSPEEWPKETKPEAKKDDDLDMESIQVSVKEEEEKVILPNVEKFSSWHRLIRATAARWVVARRLAKRDPLDFTIEDMKKAEHLWIRRHQNEYFADEMQDLKREGAVRKTSRIANLSPILNDEGVIVMASRLENAAVSRRISNPPILDPHDRYVKLMIMWYHQVSQHFGQERIVNELRRSAWILNVRAAVKRCKSECLICKMRSAKPINPEMGQLPAARVTEGNLPFHDTGVDYFGPLLVKVKRSKEKRWGVIFTCLATRALHLEIAESLSTSDMIACLIRFINLRGNPRHIWSDNGTNFVGADREIRKCLQEWDQCWIGNELLRRRIQWHYIPPAAPHMGGAWERLIQDVKRILKSLLKENYPKEGVLRTLFAEVTGIMNSRPLTGSSPDPDDPRCLTPNDLLHLECVVGPTILGEFTERDHIRETWRRSERLAQEFWERWSREYLPWLAKRQKWNQRTRPLQVGDVVLVIDDNAPRNDWRKGLVMALFPSKDGQVRIVEVKIAKVDQDDPSKMKITHLKRPVVKLCPLFEN